MIKKAINHIINIENKKYAKYIKKAVKAALEFEKVNRSYEINVELTDNDGIQKLNKTFRGKDSPTDVLSFPMNDVNPENGLIILGDIIISVEKAKEQSEELNQSLERELMFLAIHSTLHLLGYDHELSEKDDLIMREKQKEIIKYLENI